jgi:four helix bundle protein
MSGNYRAVRCARSRAEFVAKLGTVHEEADESFHWLRMSRDASIAASGTADDLLDEADQITK